MIARGRAGEVVVTLEDNEPHLHDWVLEMEEDGMGSWMWEVMGLVGLDMLDERVVELSCLAGLVVPCPMSREWLKSRGFRGSGEAYRGRPREEQWTEGVMC